MTDDLRAVFDRALDRIAAGLSPSALRQGNLGVAVSGGGDSVALLLLLVQAGFRPSVVTVDHGLRPESADEAAWVAAQCRDLGLDHDILTWGGWDGQGNLQDAARRARRRLIAGWARAKGVGMVALGHTEDDQAETLLMRLARGSGVDGLSAMAAVSTAEGVTWLRPLLEMARADLRDWLRAQGQGWQDDPGNDDPRFERVRMRRLMPALAEAGLTAERLAATATQMTRARQALESATCSLARAAAIPSELGDVTLDPEALEAAPEDLALRLWAHTLGWVSGAAYRPRLSALSALRVTGAGTLHGCLIRTENRRLIVRREPAATGPEVRAGDLWDGRWQTDGPGDLRVRALGEDGLAQCPGWRETGHARDSLLTTPGFWRGDALVANPFAKPHPDCHAALIDGISTYFASIIRR